MSLFSPDQKRRLREIRTSLKVLGQLDAAAPDANHWQAAATIAREALTIIEVGLGYQSPSFDLPRNSTLTEEVIEIEVDEDEETPIEVIVELLYNQFMVQVEALEAIVAPPQ